MTSITLHFQADSWNEIAEQMRHALFLIPGAPQPSTAGFPDDVEVNPAPEPDPIPPEPLPAPKATTRKPRSTQTATPSAPPTVPEPEPEPEPEVSQPTKPARDLPTIEALKAIVTQAVRKAQKKEGSDKILELLPAFKAKTNLGFIMEATDEHRQALADLIDAAGLAEATA